MVQSSILRRLPFSRSSEVARVSNGPLSNSTNLSRSRRGKKAKPAHQTHHLSLPLTKKGSPTVSLSSTNVIGTATLSTISPTSSSRNNLIPFPSCTTSSFPCDTPPELDIDLMSFVVVGTDGGEGKENIASLQASTAWRIDLRRRRSQSCLVPSSFVCPAPSRDDFPLNIDVPNPRMEPSRRVHTVSEPRAIKRKPVPPKPLSVKRAKKNRKQAADFQFVAMMHRSIIQSMSVSGSESQVSSQDILLAERLWLALRAQECNPVPHSCSEETPPESTKSSPRHDSFSSEQEAAQSVHHPPLQLTIPEPFPSAHHPTSSPTDTPPVADFLTMPQLVATLILRNNERCGTRSRAAARRLKNSRPRQRSSLYISTNLSTASE
ncbi:hypothetical protein BXZ70DRAFT_939352 [Cristinia sonorae]|uniref:Uncharacterized protein n=1 Tax=Cristinia sonorae TaxID=1940300 RepID=A0A8K0UP07_9AGAR|nr:hypothetical protein BXZ70DRAFT_939352 [Cristinia sonorae]